MKAQSLVGRALLSIFAVNAPRRSNSPYFTSGVLSRRNLLGFVLLTAWLFLSVSVGLCEDAATLSGTVKDQTGSAIPSAEVTLINQRTSDKRKSVTDATGTYSFKDVTAGDYRLQTSAPGFADLQKTIALSAGQAANMDLAMALPVKAQSISVDAKIDPYDVVPVTPTGSVFGLDQKIEDIPRSISTADSELLNLYSVKTVNDIVTVASGTFTGSYFGIPGSVFIRGDIGDNFFRGFRRVENRGNYDTPLSATDHIEIVKGPPSPIYGPGRIGGFMNFVPKSVRSESAKWLEKPHGAVTVTYGQYDEKVGSAEYGMPFMIGSHRSGMYVFFEAQDSHSFYKGIGNRYKMGQIAFDTELSSKWRLAYGFQGYHNEGTQNLGWNRVTQDLVDHQTYLAGTPLINLSANGYNIGANIPPGLLSTYAWQQNMGAVFPYYGNASLYALDPTTVHTVQLPFNQIMVDAGDFSRATTTTAYFDAIYDVKPGITFKNESFYDKLDHDKYSSYGFGASYYPWTVENKSTLSFLWNPHPAVSVQSYAGFGYRRVETTAGEERDQYQVVDRRDVSIGSTPNDRFQGPFNSNGQIPFNYYQTGSYSDVGLFWLSNVVLWNRVVVSAGARFDRYSPDFWGQDSVGPLVHGTATNNAGTYNASVSYRTPFHLEPYFTVATSHFLDLGQGNELDTSQIPGGTYIQPSSLYEGGVKTAGLNEKVYASLAVFRQKRSSFDRLSLQTDYYQTKGAELEARAFLLKRLTLTGTLTWQEPEQLNIPYLLGIPPSLLGLTPEQAYGGRFVGQANIFGLKAPYQVGGQPHWVASPFAMVNATKNIGFLLGTTWVSSVKAGYVSDVILPSYALWRGSVVLQKSKYQLNLGINNLSDAKYFQSQYLFWDVLIKPGALRSVGATFKYTF